MCTKYILIYTIHTSKQALFAKEAKSTRRGFVSFYYVIFNVLVLFLLSNSKWMLSSLAEVENFNVHSMNKNVLKCIFALCTCSTDRISFQCQMFIINWNTYQNHPPATAYLIRIIWTNTIIDSDCDCISHSVTTMWTRAQ